MLYHISICIRLLFLDFVLLFSGDFFLGTIVLKLHFFQNPIFDIFIHSFFTAKLMIFRALITFWAGFGFLNLVQTMLTKYFFAFITFHWIHRNVFAMLAFDLDYLGLHHLILSQGHFNLRQIINKLLYFLRVNFHI